MEIAKTKYNDPLIKGLLKEVIKLVPGIAGELSDEDITIDNDTITILVVCKGDIRPSQVCLMAQSTIYYELSRWDEHHPYFINLIIKEIKG
ncbi:hypothetical protein [Mycoplasma bradburyae]|uniref:Uncharacterized protein n=1 Tax=Mycoplasma bradburyae TaxID=2963128 RepID=A0AAW6HPE3_9MOLU|nr:hypothetical protein [Mycoplasma bradburyae]MDC4163448.1 hypothetical protein [Mycoplasma bradburyae]MDC4182049.1 hypothetical protein [Mycoplasma bradburyae]MDC4182822.1 hypothetical protein [Mycoplasma bradburyae]MDC4183496.1 hypothetical protein [Mycoplasma bradburyae]MDC4184235.1 hypothetical protein [Mycoplasma bradburyae]